MIPRRLHYCWFGGAPKPDLVQFCIRSWREHCSGYEVIEWNESNFQIQDFPVAAAAYQFKKFAFVSDVVRAYVLYTQGGIYVDADVEIRRNLDRFLSHSAFTGFEKQDIPFTAVWGSVANHRLAKMVLEFYSRVDASGIIGIPNTRFIREMLVEKFDVDPERDEIQNCADGLVIYPSNFFCVNLPENYTTHHFAGSWLEQEEIPHYSDLVKATFYAKSLRMLALKGIKTDELLDGVASDREKLKRHMNEIYGIIRRIFRRRIGRILRV